MSVFKLSTPTKDQIIHDSERVVAVFLVSAFAVWTQNGSQFTKAAVVGALAAGGTAVYSLVKSFITVL
jgi:hypothetical protein